MELREYEGKVAIDLERRVGGIVVKAHGKGEFVSPFNGEVVAGEVFEMDGGDSFVAYPLERWRVLDEKGLEFYGACQKVVADATRMLFVAAKGAKLDLDSAMSIVGRALFVQGRSMMNRKAES